MAVDTSAAPLVGSAGTRLDEPTKRRAPIVWWAGFGALMLAFIVFVLGRWVTGPWFKTVPSGPSTPPAWMKAALIFWQSFAVIGTVVLLYVLLIRPWRRERQVRTDGLLVGAFFLVFFQDPLSSIFGDWFSWNAYLLNRGSWIYSIPGSEAYGRPGAAVVEPILGGFLWVWIAFGGAWFGAFVLRFATRRWPSLRPPVLIAAVLFPTMMVFDFVLEGLVTIPTGLYVYSGGRLSLFPDAYNKYPLHEAVFAGATLSGLAALRFFKNDRGETLVERGLSDLRVGAGKRVALRFLALVCATQLIPFVTYNLPSGWVAGAHSGTWPKAVQRLSYFTAHLCGAGTETLCPQDGVPLVANGSVQIAPDGRLVVPAGSAAARLDGLPPGASITVRAGRRRLTAIPFSKGNVSPFSGPVIGNTH